MPQKWIAFDGDDTLWENEIYYTRAKTCFKELLAGFGDPAFISTRLDEIEEANVRWYGYGIKSFALSMIETAVVLSDGHLKSSTLQSLLDLTHEMLEIRVDILPGVEHVLDLLSAKNPLLLITKGDTFEQYRKVQRTGLARYFYQVEIVAEKTPTVYQALLEKYQISPHRFIMVGNSLRSDILPVLSIGAQAVYIPYHATWAHENVTPAELIGYSITEIPSIKQLPDILSTI